MLNKPLTLLAVCALAITLLLLEGCGPRRVSLARLKLGADLCETTDCYARRMLIPPHRVTINQETGIETWAYDTDVQRTRRTDKTQGARYWYEGYYMDCTYEVSFDSQGNKVDQQWIGAGCFNSQGGFYQEGLFGDID